MDIVTDPALCPTNDALGRPVKVVTLKSLLRPSALATLEPRAQHHYCPDPGCDTVYFADGRTYGRADVEVPVFAKDPNGSVPVCYCFGWTRDRLSGPEANGAPTEIRGHVRAGRCGCEVNNPKGACCLGDVERLVEERPSA